jgi:hypothetical protein
MRHHGSTTGSLINSYPQVLKARNLLKGVLSQHDTLTLLCGLVSPHQHDLGFTLTNSQMLLYTEAGKNLENSV